MKTPSLSHLLKFVLLGFINVSGLAAPLAALAAATEFMVVPAESTLTFEAVGRPSMLKIKGSGKELEGSFQVDGNLVKGQLKFSLMTMTTGIDLRDDHMKNKYLEVGKFPEAVLKITDLKANGDLKDPKAIKAPRQDFTGTLTLHGTEKPIEGSFEISKSNKVEAQFEIKLSDYAIAIPSYMGITVADLVKVNVNLKLEKRK